MGSLAALIHRYTGDDGSLGLRVAGGPPPMMEPSSDRSNLREWARNKRVTSSYTNDGVVDETQMSI